VCLKGGFGAFTGGNDNLLFRVQWVNLNRNIFSIQLLEYIVKLAG
jgi:hypothetical protein